MNDDLNSREEFKSRPPMTPKQKKILQICGVVLLVVVAFFVGRYSTQMKSSASNPFAQLPPTPVPMGTPVPVVESALTMINFTDAPEAKRAQVLADFNSQYCRCNCKMTVAACMVKDPNCPFWKDHVNQFQSALGNGKKPYLPKNLPSRPALHLAPTGSNGFTMPQGNPNAFTVPAPAGK